MVREQGLKKRWQSSQTKNCHRFFSPFILNKQKKIIQCKICNKSVKIISPPQKLCLAKFCKQLNRKLYVKNNLIKYREYQRKSYNRLHRKSQFNCEICKEKLGLNKRKYCFSCIKKVNYNERYPAKTKKWNLRFTILNRDNFKCVYCGRGVNDNVILNVDHIIPKSKGGKTISENLQTACRECNVGKLDSIILK